MASMSYSETNSKWLSLRKEFSGRSGKYYWQDVAGLQDRLSTLLENATSVTETTVVRTLKAMLRSQPSERPDAAALTLVFTPASCCLSWPNDQATYPGPREELSSVEVLVHEDGVDCNAQLHQHAEITTAPLQDLASAKNWLDQCSNSHEVCSHSTSGDTQTLPSRLLDIQPDDGEPHVRVVDSSAIDGTVDYVALSHAWNASSAFLTTENLPALSTSLPLCALSGTLRTAITSSQRLGYRYIWTDSLCILQNSESDKRTECTTMASVFRNAALTLVLDTNTSAELTRDSWDTRAWTLQERLLSRRFLHLGQEQMYWECNSLKASETFPRGLPALVWEKAHSKGNPQHAIVVPNAITDKKDSLRPLRNRQWVRKEGDANGESLGAAASTLDARAGSLTVVNDKLGNYPVFTTSTCGDGATGCSGKDPATRQVPSQLRTQGSFVDPGDDSSSSTEIRSKSSRQEIRASGQLDQNGSLGEEGDGDENERGDKGRKV